MRQKAQQAGNLKTTPQENVSTKGKRSSFEPADARCGLCTSIRSMAGVWVSAGRVPRLVSVSGAFLGWPGNRFRTGLRGWIICRLRLGLGQLGIRLARRRKGRLQHNTYISHSRTIVNRNNFIRPRGLRPAMRLFGEPFRTRRACIPARLAGSTMAGLRGATLSAGSQLWRIPWRGWRGFPWWGGGFHGAAGAADSSYEVIKP